MYSGFQKLLSPGLHTLNIIVNKLVISVDWFMFDKGPKYVADQSRLTELEKEVEQIKKTLDSQHKDYETRL